MTEQAWLIEEVDPNAVRVLACEAGVSEITARVLLSRGIRAAPEARRFLQPSLDQMHDPLQFAGMEAAVERIRSALQKRERIALFGDYDVDGISGLCIMARALRLWDAEPILRVPHRQKEGYGLSPRSVRKLREEGASLLITIDCGTMNHEELELARREGMDVVVLDHHAPGETLPPAVAVINPKCPESGYPFESLCSGGIALKTALALSDRLPQAAKESARFKSFLLDGFSLATLATYADFVPLVGENRVLARFGIEALREAPNPGLRRLLQRLKLDDRTPGEFDILFKIAPRLNAIGRLGDATDTARLFLSDDPAEIDGLLDLAERANRERQKIERKMVTDAVRIVKKEGLAEAPAIVVSGRDWHTGVAGIVAQRLVSRFHRPAVVLCPDGDRLRGSARTIGGFDLAAAISTCRGRIEGVRGGGHAQAAGVDLPRRSLKAFRGLFERLAAEREAEPARPPLRIEAEAGLEHITSAFCREISRLEPFGNGNARPVFSCCNLEAAGPPQVHRDQHTAFRVSNGERSLRAIAFNNPELGPKIRSWKRFDLAVSVQLNRDYGGAPELVVAAARPSPEPGT